MKELTWPDVWGRRLAQHALLAPRPRDDLVEVVRTVCGIHAQVMPAVRTSIESSAAGITRQDVRDAIGNLPLVLVDGVVAGLWQQRRG